MLGSRHTAVKTIFRRSIRTRPGRPNLESRKHLIGRQDTASSIFTHYRQFRLHSTHPEMNAEALPLPIMDNAVSPEVCPPGPTVDAQATGQLEITQQHVENMIASLPLIRFLRQSNTTLTPRSSDPPIYKELRLHGSMHPSAQAVHMMSGSLTGPSKLIIDPHFFLRGHHAISTCYIGAHVCGHPGYVHGGLLFSLFDDIFARCAGTVFKSGVGMTANLNIDYRRPPRTDRVYVARAGVVKMEGRKVWVSGSIRCLNAFTVDEMDARPDAMSDELSVEEEEADLVAEASALFIEPKFAGSMVSLFQNS